MAKLRDYSLIEGVPGAYRVHPCVHDWLLEQFRASFDISWFSAALDCVEGSIPNFTASHYWVTGRRLIQHMQRLTSTCFELAWLTCLSEGSAKVTGRCFADVYYDFGRLQEAEQMYLRLHSASNEASTAEYFPSPDLDNGLGVLYYEQGRLVQAEQIFLQALARMEEVYGSEDPTTLHLVNNLGMLYIDQGRLFESEQMYVRALVGYQKALGNNHATTLNTVHNLGSLYRDQGRLIESQRAYERALTGCEKALGPENPSTLQTVNGLGNIYFDQGRLTEAEQMHKRALSGFRKVLGEEHASTLNATHELCLLYAKQGRISEAIPLYNQALSTSQAIVNQHRFPPRDAILILASVLCDLVKLLTDALSQHRRIVDLATLAKSTNDGFVTQALGESLLSINEDRHAQLAYRYSVRRIGKGLSDFNGHRCRGCFRLITVDMGLNVCRQCVDLKLCHACLRRYADNILVLPLCTLHSFFTVDDSDAGIDGHAISGDSERQSIIDAIVQDLQQRARQEL